MSGADPEALRQKVLQWMAVAQIDRDAAEMCLAAFPTVAAFHCQQAAEKLLKGFLVRANVDFRKTHDLKELGQAAAARFPELAPIVRKLERWTVWSFAYRYPAETVPDPPPPSIAELNAALETIDRLAAVLRALKSGDKAGGRG